MAVVGPRPASNTVGDEPDPAAVLPPAPIAVLGPPAVTPPGGACGNAAANGVCGPPASAYGPGNAAGSLGLALGLPLLLPPRPPPLFPAICSAGEPLNGSFPTPGRFCCAGDGGGLARA